MCPQGQFCDRPGSSPIFKVPLNYTAAPEKFSTHNEKGLGPRQLRRKFVSPNKQTHDTIKHVPPISAVSLSFSFAFCNGFSYLWALPFPFPFPLRFAMGFATASPAATARSAAFKAVAQGTPKDQALAAVWCTIRTRAFETYAATTSLSVCPRISLMPAVMKGNAWNEQIPRR